MSIILSGAATVALAGHATAGLIAAKRIFKGPAVQDRILALDTLYAIGMLAVMVIGILQASPVYFEAALLIALFGYVSSAAMAKFLLRGEVIE